MLFMRKMTNKHNGDFILEYYVKNTEDIEIIQNKLWKKMYLYLELTI